jgi:membrane-associated phospholipid phosphatase
MTKFNLMFFADIISAFPLVIYCGLLYNYLIDTKNIVDLIILLYLLLGHFIHKGLKAIPYPEPFYSVSRRPKGAENCDLLSKNGPVKDGTPGFPSGHMLSITLFASFMIFSKWKLNGEGNITNFITKNFMFVIVNLGLIVLTAFARYYKKCHNILQIIAGTIIGLIMGIILYYILESYEMFKIKSKLLYV